tara:strand:- start:2228 stop:2872 length:645 start_codon:yes stop_codon:yes gene_type:complete
VAYRPGESMRLNEVNKFIQPESILDIGAHSGQFYGWAKNVWPNVPIFMIEANQVHAEKLKSITQNNHDNYLIAALGDKVRDVTFYTRKDKPWTEGNSYYKEHNFWDIPQLVLENKVTLKKLDDLFEDGAKFDIIKIDTQGSEKDIIQGGINLIHNATVLILEVSYIEYNEGAPTATEVTNFLTEIGFEEKISIGEHYDGDKIIQKDIVFLNQGK